MPAIKKEDLNFIKGTVKFDEPMSLHTTFKIGGPADVWVSPADEDDLLALLRYAAENKIDIYLVGGGSKILVGDKGVRGVVISLDSPAFCGLDFDGETVNGETVNAGCGIKIHELIRDAAERELGGLEFLAGIPGTLGGALVMNAGWPTKAIGDFVEGITAVRGLEKIRLGKNDLSFSYRNSNLEGLILLSAGLKLEMKSKGKIEDEIKAVLGKKKKTQDLDHPSIGSIFLNPSGTRPAWELVEKSGFRGKAIGGASVSEKHANFIINRGRATALDVHKLIEEIQKKVFKDYQIMLKLEVKLTGEF